jgi:hypothetical protein
MRSLAPTEFVGDLDGDIQACGDLPFALLVEIEPPIMEEETSTANIMSTPFKLEALYPLGSRQGEDEEG